MMNHDHSDLKSIPVLSLAFVGDGVFDLLVREHLVRLSGARVGELNRAKVELVNCRSQAQLMQTILPYLTEEEAEIYRRGRNAKVNSPSRHSTLADYHAATGLEALFGYLYLKGDRERINDLFARITGAVSAYNTPEVKE